MWDEDRRDEDASCPRWVHPGSTIKCDLALSYLLLSCYAGPRRIYRYTFDYLLIARIASKHKITRCHPGLILG